MSNYYQQAKLMLQVLAIVAEEQCFALKGGTAINFFVRNLPRYSIDIDLTYILRDKRELALQKLVSATESIAQEIEKRLSHLRVTRRYSKKNNRLVKLLVNNKNTQVKVEPNELIRGAVFEVSKKMLVEKAETEFDAFVSMNILSHADLYGGKICAALDRQHPRDLFDVKLLLENEGITDAVRKAFVVYLASHNRPINEILNPNFLDIETIYKSDFEGMTRFSVDLNELIDTRQRLVKLINETLTDSDRQFLLSLKMGKPEWFLMGLDDLHQFPAIQWKLLNIKKMDKVKHQQAVDKLKCVLMV